MAGTTPAGQISGDHPQSMENIGKTPDGYRLKPAVCLFSTDSSRKFHLPGTKSTGLAWDTACVDMLRLSWLCLCNPQATSSNPGSKVQNFGDIS